MWLYVVRALNLLIVGLKILLQYGHENGLTIRPGKIVYSTAHGAAFKNHYISADSLAAEFVRYSKESTVKMQ